MIIYEKNHQLCLKNAMNSDIGFQIDCIASLWHTLMSERREFINTAPQPNPVLQVLYHLRSLSETFKLFPPVPEFVFCINY